MVSSKVAFIVSLLLASIVGQVYSKLCYTCIYNSITGESKDCKGNPAQSKYVKACSNTKDSGKDLIFTFDIDYFCRFPEEPSVAFLTVTAKANEFNCAVLEGKYKGNTIVSRGCIESTFTCESIKEIMPIEIGKCSICHGNLCNASSKAGIAIFPLIFCLASYVIFQ